MTFLYYWLEELEVSHPSLFARRTVGVPISWSIQCMYYSNTCMYCIRSINDIPQFRTQWTTHMYPHTLWAFFEFFFHFIWFKNNVAFPIVLEWTVWCSQTAQFFVMFDMSEVRFWVKMWCSESSMLRHSMFGVFEVRYFGVHSKTKWYYFLKACFLPIDFRNHGSSSAIWP